jgi:hypothetical protein
VRHGVKSLAEIKDEHIHLLLVIQVSADFFDCDYYSKKEIDQNLSIIGQSL